MGDCIVVRSMEDYIAGESEYYEELVDEDTEEPGEEMEELEV
jgi:hypothetical protein